MGLRCARIECSEMASASLMFQAGEALVQIIDLADATAGIPLCAEHTRTRTAPVGWDIIDSRTPARLDQTVVEAPADDLTGPDERPPLRRKTDEPFQWGREAKTSADADLEADSPLLSRAFSPVQDS